MITTFLLSAFLAIGTVSAVTITVLPLIVEPDFTPFFSVRCAILEQETTGLITAISLYRRPSTPVSAQGAPRELIAELRGAYQSRPRLAPGFENLLIQGQISAAATETEFGTFLEVTWPNPKAQDLGLYVCESTTLGALGAVTMFAEARVTSASPVTDRLLATVSALQADVANLNRSLTVIHNDIRNLSSAIQQQNASRNGATSPVAPPSGYTSQAAAPAPSVTGNTTGYNQGSTQGNATGNTTATEVQPAQASPIQPPGEELEQLVSATLELVEKFEHFNATLERLGNLLESLQKEIVEASNETIPEQAPVDHLLSYFVSGNGTYFLFNANLHTDSYRAQIVCESKRLHLAEIIDEDEFLNISSEISPYVKEGGVVLVGGKKRYGREEFLYQKSQEPASFLAWEIEESKDTKTSDCLAFQKYEFNVSLVVVPCSIDQENVYFLCQHERRFY